MSVMKTSAVSKFVTTFQAQLHANATKDYKQTLTMKRNV